MLTLGQKAPAFTLPDQKGKKHKLADYKGQWVLLYFYPKDNTPGCTKEACTFRDKYSSFKKIKAVVLGVSADSVDSHGKFAGKFKLPFPILSDEKRTVIEKYGAWQLKINFGKKYYGIKRMSVLVDPKGNVAKIYKVVKPAEHAAQVLRDLDKLAS
ncbi:thioredoxin-dependent thiol peroxidase [Candidatus Falkowbacteria bacterium CG10_big_fil_rev_8_21_14_0_10_39_11]|uniref:thioredoxin-dependent peroxiredoxin n=1 Tax=Candidatus Falkowbacteria bacterium CG10_big_fil_rev_8_21_14_0_10_39_11 TaxID=1974565 RepID=A0A2H0V4E9_9BACT|nr:MAG: thioredoxin-dependent thiol peroxidase [Candidatus Falkowbacteria bacterium CG10_big_fil_rev_8_21_14_0_10_39_11]